jgi:hypothetical protein
LYQPFYFQFAIAKKKQESGSGRAGLQGVSISLFSIDTFQDNSIKPDMKGVSYMRQID